jgi:Nucleolar protein,Nop52
MANTRPTPVGATFDISNFSLDKFYLLARRFIAAGFRFLQSENWSKDRIKDYNKMLSAGPLQYGLHGSQTNVQSERSQSAQFNTVPYHR